MSSLRIVKEEEARTEDPAQGIIVFCPQAFGSESYIQEVARRDPGRIGVGIIGSRSDDVNQSGSVARCGATSQRLIDRRKHSAAVQADLLVLVTCQRKGSGIVRDARHDKAAVEPPSQADPQTSQASLRELILYVGGLLEALVVIGTSEIGKHFVAVGAWAVVHSIGGGEKHPFAVVGGPDKLALLVILRLGHFFFRRGG